jgi:biotin operon repressor
MATFANFKYKGRNSSVPYNFTTKLNGNERGLYLTIIMLSQHTGYAHVSQKTLKEYMEWSIRKIQKTLYSLRDKGYIIILTYPNKASKYIPLSEEGFLFEIKNKWTLADIKEKMESQIVRT